MENATLSAAAAADLKSPAWASARLTWSAMARVQRVAAGDRARARAGRIPHGVAIATTPPRHPGTPYPPELPGASPAAPCLRVAEPLQGRRPGARMVIFFRAETGRGERSAVATYARKKTSGAA
jgi:hypothetical protein